MEEALGHAETVVHLGPYVDETAAASEWHVPLAHPLETCGNLRAGDGTASIVQPVIAPLYGGRNAGGLVDALTAEMPRSAYQIVRAHWREELGADDFETARQ